MATKAHGWEFGRDVKAQAIPSSREACAVCRHLEAPLSPQHSRCPSRLVPDIYHRGSPVQTVGHGLPRPPFGRLWDVRKGCWLWPPGHRPPAAVGCTQRPRDAARAQPVGHVNVHVLGIREKLSDCLSSHRELLTWHGEDLSACGLRTEGRAADPSQAKFKGREGPWCWEGLVGAEGLPRSGRGAARPARGIFFLNVGMAARAGRKRSV